MLKTTRLKWLSVFDLIRSYPVHPCRNKGFEVKYSINRDIQDIQDKNKSNLLLKTTRLKWLSVFELIRSYPVHPC